MTGAEEREAFSQRLRTALDQAGWKAMGATLLAREFNRRNSGPAITAHATRKWLQGEAIPAQGNLQDLASWLEVPAPWLRFGEPLRPPQAAESPPTPYVSEQAAKVAADFLRLGAQEQRVVESLIVLLLARSGTADVPSKPTPRRR
ncbi:MAG: hypothetical protein REJ24_22180 [Rhodocyclaceae bacterium]|nr:hypothetical protein [Rhodocyclaceae bacterium]